MDYTTFLDKTTSFPKRNGLIRNTSSISHTVAETWKHPWFLRVGSKVFSSGKQKEEKLYDHYVNHKL